jgi:hypothetical protein
MFSVVLSLLTGLAVAEEQVNGTDEAEPVVPDVLANKSNVEEPTGSNEVQSADGSKKKADKGSSRVKSKEAAKIRKECTEKLNAL